MKRVLLDIDGVLVRDKALLDHVKANCERYVAQKLPSAKKPADVNRVLYLAHGHTARGLRDAFGIDIHDFNDSVYDKNLMSHLWEVLSGTEFQEEAREIHDLVERGNKITLFTNSPDVWARQVAISISDEIDYRCPQDYNWLKPEAPAYMQFPSNQNYIYIDDSLKNLGTARWLDNWQCVHYLEGPADPRAWCPTVNSFWDLVMYLNSSQDPSGLDK